MKAPARVALYGAFLLSGAAALVYESIWSRYLGLLLGHSAFAQVIVLTVFLGGMAIGATLTGLRSESLRSPLLWYAGVEIVVALFGFAFHDVYGAVSAGLYEHVFPRIGSSPALLAPVKTATAALLILPQSILLGATFPLMSAGVLRWMPRRSGGVLGWLYATNSLGASLGVLVAGFYLTPRFGLPGTIIAAAILNLAAGGFAVGVQRLMKDAAPDRADRADSGAADETVAAAGGDEASPRLRRLLLVAAFGTAVASFAYEIAWIRMLSLVLGSATHSFELMLSAFILGLGLGALWIGLRGDRIVNPIRALIIVQCVMGALAAATLPLYVASFAWLTELLNVFARTAQGYVGFTAARYILCLMIMLPATICAGMTLPLITKILYRSGAQESAIGEVYGANTAGSIIGVQLASLVLLPILGLKALLVGAALTDIAIGAMLVTTAGTAPKQTRVLVTSAVVAVFAVIAGAWSSPFDQRVMHGGVFRTGQMPNPDAWTMMYRGDGRTASISVRRSTEGLVVLSTNGKPDASLTGSWFQPDSTRRPLRNDDETQLLLPLVGLAHRANARTAAVIGHGSGITSHVLLGAPGIQRVTTIEIEPEIVRASMVFFPFNRRVFEDPRSRIVLDDARAYFAGAAEPFDLIVSEPSNPWVSGVSGLFTKEFYSEVRRHLSPGGVFVQWVQLYEMNDDLVRMILATVQSSFPVYDVFMVGEGDIAVIATAGDIPAAPDWSVVDFPGVREDLARVVPLTPTILSALHVADSKVLGPYVGPAPTNSDYEPLLDLQAERARFIGSSAMGFRTLNSVSYDFASAMSRRQLGLSRQRVTPIDAARPHVRSTSARLRASLTTDSVIRDSTVFSAMQRRNSHDRVIASGVAPRNWQLFTLRLASIDRDIHAGSAGVVDSSLFNPLPGYLRSSNAPPVVRNVVQFLHGVNSWDFAAAATAADDLVSRQARGEIWIPPDYLRDGAVTAKLEVGDPRGALRVFYLMQRFTRKDEVGAFRSALLLSQIARAFAPR